MINITCFAYGVCLRRNSTNLQQNLDRMTVYKALSHPFITKSIQNSRYNKKRVIIYHSKYFIYIMLLMLFYTCLHFFYTFFYFFLLQQSQQYLDYLYLYFLQKYKSLLSEQQLNKGHMPEVKPEPEDIIIQKLEKVKCVTNCQNNANYLIFGYGLYCSSCLAQVKDVNPDQFVSFGNLATIIINLVDDYDKSNKSQISHFKVTKTQAQKSKAQLKKIRDSLSFDIKSVKSKSNASLDQSYSFCLKQFRTEPLQALYQPDLTATSIINQTSLLLSNLNILTVQQKQGQKKYKFRQKQKNPEQIFKQTKKKYQQLRECIQSADIQVKGIMQNFRKEVKELN